MAKARPTPPPQIEAVERGWYVPPLTRNPARQQWPHRLVFWDCQGEPRDDGGFDLACAVAHLHQRVGPPGEHEYEPAAYAACATAAELWQVVDGWTRRKESMRLYAHDHTRPLGMAEWWRHLGEAMGYTGTPGRDFLWSTGGQVPYLRLRRDGRSPITFCDAWDLFGCTPSQLAADLDWPDPQPQDDHQLRASWAVQVTAAAVLRYLARLRDLGVTPRGFTGPSHGFAVMRTLHLQPHHVEHHGDAVLWAVEDASRMGGRREAWRHGVVAEPCEDWDYQHAHASICRNPVPSRCFHAEATPMAVVMQSERWVDLQEWIVETEVPCVPYRDRRRGLVFPVGRFPATLWAPEAAMAMRHGATLRPGGRRWRYELVPSLAGWAEWIIEQMADPDALWRRVCKRWSHTTPGKWGQSNSTYETSGTHGFWDSQEFELRYCDRHPDGYDRMLYSPAGVWGIRDAQQPAEYANYAIQSWIMSQSRIRLWRAMQAAGLANVVQVNTDGLVVTRRGAASLEAVGVPGLRPKHEYRRGVDVRNAQAVLDLDRRQHRDKVAGLPHGAVRTGPDTWDTETWHQGLVTGPVVVPRVWTLPPGPLGRVRAADGQTTPYLVRK